MKKKELARRIEALEHVHGIDCDAVCSEYERHLEAEVARLNGELAAARAALAARPVVVTPAPYRPPYTPMWPYGGTITVTSGSTTSTGLHSVSSAEAS